MRHIKLSPVDTWFFRDARPFSAELGYQMDAGGVFPPHPSTVAGCLRGALARSKGWPGYGEWSAELKQTLGDGLDDLGALSFSGPFLLHSGQPLFSVPRHMLRARSGGGREAAEALLDLGGATLWRQNPSANGREAAVALLAPGGSPVALSDLGEKIQFPKLPNKVRPENYKNFPGGSFLDVEGFNDVLAGKTPHVEKTREKLWKEEPRVGLERDDGKRTAMEGQLYSARHFRLHKNVTLAVSMEGALDWELSSWAPLGGEARAAAIEEWDGDLHLRQPLKEIRRSGKFAVVVLTPLDLSEPPGPGARIEELNAAVVSACVDRPLRIGGWDSRGGGPLPLRNCLAPGSVLFCQGLPPEAIQAAEPAAIGRRTNLGFGRVALGLWPGEQKT